MSTFTPLREPLTQAHIAMIERILGVGALIFNLDQTDYTRGALLIQPGEKCFWLQDGRRVGLNLLPDEGNGVGFAGYITDEPDPERPEPIYPAPDRSLEIAVLLQQILDPVQKCIHPDCEQQVDLRQRKSGACCKTHQAFECTFPACVRRAKQQHWARATHPHVSKIGAEHWQYHAVNTQ